MKPIDLDAIASRVKRGEISRLAKQLAGAFAQKLVAGADLSEPERRFVAAMLETIAVYRAPSIEHRIAGRKRKLERLTGEQATQTAARDRLDREDGNQPGATKRALARERKTAKAESWAAYECGEWDPGIDSDADIDEACAGLPDDLATAFRCDLEARRETMLRDFLKLTGRKYEGQIRRD